MIENDNNKLSIISKIHKAKYKFKEEKHTDVYRDRVGITYLGEGIPSRPVATSCAHCQDHCKVLFFYFFKRL